jgi:hypothetical protein
MRTGDGEDVDRAGGDKGLVDFVGYLSPLADEHGLEKPPARQGGVRIEKGLYPLPPAIEPSQEGVSPVRAQDFNRVPLADIPGDQDAEAPQVSCIVKGAWVEEVAGVVELGLKAYAIAIPQGHGRISDGDPYPPGGGNNGIAVRDPLGHKMENNLLRIPLGG